MMMRSALLVAGVAMGGIAVAFWTARADSRSKGDAKFVSQQSKIDGFPVDAGTLQTMRAGADPAPMRAHAWNLLYELTKGSGKLPKQTPLWETDEANWKTKCDLDLNDLCKQAAVNVAATPLAKASGKAPRIALAGSPQMDQVGAARLTSTVFFSRDAADWIKANHLESGTQLQTILGARTAIASDAGDGRAPVIADMPRTGIVVKEILQAFNVNKPQIFGFGPQVLGRAAHDGLGSIVGWGADAKVVMKTNQDGTLDTTTECDAKADYGGKPVPLRCFPYRSTDGRCDELVMVDPEAADQVSGPDPIGARSCVVVVVGIHVATKEVKNWTWSTFWWVADPSKSDSMAGQRADLPPGYSHFAMKTMISPDVMPADTSTLPAIYNPYLEGGPTRGMTTNCMGCHARARYEAVCVAGTAGCGAQRSGGKVDGAFIMAPMPPPCVLAGDARIKDCSLTTSFLWSLPSNQDTVSHHRE